MTEETYEVEQIVDHRTRRGKKEYQVKWVGYPIEQSTWQSKTQLIEDGCKISIDRYEAALRGEVIDDRDEEVIVQPNPESETKAGSELTVTVGTGGPANASNPIDSTDEDECIRRALSDDHGADALRQAQIAMCTFNAGYAEPPRCESDSKRRMELAYAIAASTIATEMPTPRNYREAISGPNAREWSASMDEEWNTLQEQGAWVYIKRSTLPRHANVLPSKFVYRVKLTETGAIDKYKSRLCPGGHRQKRGLDYEETFSSTGKYKTQRFMMSMAARDKHRLHQMDVPSAFIKADLKEDVYMEIPEHYRTGHEDEVLHLKKSVYGLHQSGRNWWLLITNFIVERLGFRQCVSDPNFFFKRSRTGKLMTMFLFVDDFQASTDPEDQKEWEEYLGMLKKEFNIKYLGEPTWLLGMRITRQPEKGTITLDQTLYIDTALKRFGFDDCRTVDTPEEMQSKKGDKTPSTDADEPADRAEYLEKVGTLIYASISTRPDIAHAVHQCATHMQQPMKKHMKMVDRIFRYLAGTRQMGLVFGSRKSKNATADARSHTSECIF